MRFTPLLLVMMLLLSACRSARPERDAAPEASLEETIDHASYEDFDPSEYEVEAGNADAIEHDVPAGLMNNRPEAGATRTVQGFRVQITQTQDKAAADALVGEASAWWREQAGRTNAPAYFKSGEAPVYVMHRQPYYRVRVGNFATQAEAQRAASQIARRFPGAAVVPDTVTVAR